MADLKESDEKFPRRAQKKRETRDKIVSAARQLFQTRGYESATMAEIAEAADVHVTTMFTHFKTKRDLANALAEVHVERLQTLISNASGSVPFFDFFRTMVGGWASLIQKGAKQSTDYGYDLRSNPELSFIWLRRHQSEISLYANYFAKDYGLDINRDPLPYLVANMLTSANVLAHDRWLDSKGKTNLRKEALHSINVCQAMVESYLKR
jgi:AcrR family transcriptional regulator